MNAKSEADPTAKSAVIAGLNLQPFRQADVFVNLDDAFCREALACAHLRHWRSGATLFRQGEDANTYFIVINGWVRLVRFGADGQTSTLSVVGAGRSIAALSILKEARYPVEASAISKVTTLCWNRTDGRQLCASNPRFSEELLRIITRRFEREQDRAIHYLSHSVERRLAHALTRIAEDYPDAGFPPLLRSDLAGLIGSTVPTVSRTLSVLRARGLVKVGRRRVEICDLEKLKELA